MAFLIESGTLYLTVQIMYLAFLAKPPHSDAMRVVFTVLASTYAMLSAMYPTFISVLTNLELSPSEVVLASFKLSDKQI